MKKIQKFSEWLEAISPGRADAMMKQIQRGGAPAHFDPTELKQHMQDRLSPFEKNANAPMQNAPMQNAPMQNAPMQNAPMQNAPGNRHEYEKQLYAQVSENPAKIFRMILGMTVMSHAGNQRVLERAMESDIGKRLMPLVNLLRKFGRPVQEAFIDMSSTPEIIPFILRRSGWTPESIKENLQKWIKQGLFNRFGSEYKKELVQWLNDNETTEPEIQQTPAQRAWQRLKNDPRFKGQ